MLSRELALKGKQDKTLIQEQVIQKQNIKTTSYLRDLDIYLSTLSSLDIYKKNLRKMVKTKKNVDVDL